MKNFIYLMAIGLFIANAPVHGDSNNAPMHRLQDNMQNSDSSKRWVSGKEQYQQFVSEYKAGKYQSQLDQLSDDIKKMQQDKPELFQQTMEHARQNKSKIEQMNKANEKILNDAIVKFKDACKGNESEQICTIVASIEQNNKGAKDFNDAFTDIHALALAKDQSSYDDFAKKASLIINNGTAKILYPLFSRQPIEQINLSMQRAIEYEMVENLRKLAETEPKNKLAEKINLIVKNYPAHYANFIDAQTLSLLANGKITPQNPTEESVQRIAQKMEQERRDELKKLFPLPNQNTNQDKESSSN